MNRGARAFILFFLGLFYWWRIRLVGAIGVSEIFIAVWAPFLVAKDIRGLRAHGFMPIIWFGVADFVGCLLSSLYNHTAIGFAIRGLATPYILTATIIVSYHLLKYDLSLFKWMVIGLAISVPFTAIIHGNAAAVFEAAEFYENEDVAAISVVYMLVPILLLPIKCWYSKIPSLLSALLVFACAGFCLIFSISGRSTAFSIAMGGVLILLGGRTRRGLVFLKKHFILFLLSIFLTASLAKIGYQELAENGYLGEKAYQKYVAQTKKGTGALDLLIAGRTYTFVGLYALMDHPLMGFGPWPFDTQGYYQTFLTKYGSDEDVRRYLSNYDANGYVLLPGHSHIVSFWLWHGIIGLIYWIYVLYLILTFFRKHVDAIPPLYGYFCLSIPVFLWAIVFSPISERMFESFLLTTIIISRAVWDGRMPFCWGRKMEVRIRRRGE